jgi:hypothetical protein
MHLLFVLYALTLIPLQLTLLMLLPEDHTP